MSTFLNLPPTRWTFIFWSRKNFCFVFSFTSRPSNTTTKLSKSISVISRMFFDKFWSDRRWFWCEFEAGKARFQHVKKSQYEYFFGPPSNQMDTWFLKKKNFFLSCLPSLLGLQIQRQRYLKASLLLVECFSISFEVIEDDSDVNSRQEKHVFNM